MQALAARLDEPAIRDTILNALKDKDQDVRLAAVTSLEAWIVREKLSRLEPPAG